MTHYDLNAISEEPLVYFSDGDPAARIGLTMTFYFGAPGDAAKRQALVNCIQVYLNQARGQLRCYAVRGDKRHRKLQSGENPDPALLQAMLDTSTTLDFEAGGAGEGISHSWSIGALAADVVNPTYLGYLLLTYPLAILERLGLGGFIQQFVSICDSLQVEHAYGGLGLILPFDVDSMNAAQEVIGEIAMKYPGLDAYDLSGVMLRCRQGIKSVNFLTAVSHRLLNKVGGAETVARAGPQIQSYPYSTGAVFQAGSQPQLGAPDRPPQEYVVLGRALKPVRAPFADSMFDDPAGEDDEAFTQHWLSRFDG